jgi:hypothetical protein
MTISDTGCSFDPNPPAAPEPHKGGRPPSKREQAERFIREALGQQDGRIGTELCSGWQETGGNYKTFWRAVEEMEAAGDLATEGGPGEGRQKVLYLKEKGPDTDRAT